jgi:hypothetical protein
VIIACQASSYLHDQFGHSPVEHPAAAANVAATPVHWHSDRGDFDHHD